MNYVLSLPGKNMFRADFPLGELRESGDSLLIMPEGVVRMNLDFISGPPGTLIPVHIVGYANARGALARLEMRIDAPGFKEAQETAHNWITPALSWWSFQDDVELDVAGVYVLEEATGVTRWIGGVLGRDRGFTARAGHVFKTDHRALFASYREGLVATNPFYRALCFYRILEGVRRMRDARCAELVSAGQQYREPEERIPSDGSVFDPLERERFTSYLGWKFTRVHNEMRGLLRNAVAHLDPAGTSLIADEYRDVDACEEAIPVLRYVARGMLRNEINADPDYAGLTVL